jgi:hypothetical protein
MLEVVGDTMFCRCCLGRMLRRVDERSARIPATAAAPAPAGREPVNGAPQSGPAGSTPERAPARTSAADAPCFICGEPLDGGAVLELRGFAICARCSPGLLGEDAAPEVDADPAGSGAVPAARADVESPAERSGPVPVLATPGAGTEWCARCGRAMPGPGSYVLVDGRPHCPGCAAAVAQRTRSTDESFAPDGCDACGRALGASPVPETAGFRLCAACLASDPDLAVALARARHQRRLARATRRLLDGDND